MGKLGLAFKDQWAQAVDSFKTWLSASSAVMLVVSKTKEAVTELKEIDTILTEISKTNDKLSKSDLKNIGNNAFETASKYGKKQPIICLGFKKRLVPAMRMRKI